MKRKIGIIVTLSMVLFSLLCMNVFANEYGIIVRVNGEKVTFDVEPQITNSRTMVPLRAIFEELDATVEWNGEEQKITATKDNITITLKIGDTYMYVNDKQITLDAPAYAVDGRTLVPLRAVSEAFNAVVEWIPANNTSMYSFIPDLIYIVSDENLKSILYDDQNYYGYPVKTAQDATELVCSQSYDRYSILDVTTMNMSGKDGYVPNSKMYKYPIEYAHFFEYIDYLDSNPYLVKKETTTDYQDYSKYTNTSHFSSSKTYRYDVVVDGKNMGRYIEVEEDISTFGVFDCYVRLYNVIPYIYE